MDAVIEWLAQYGGWGVVMLLAGFFVWLVLTGKLVTKGMADQLQHTNEKLSEALERYSESWPRVLAYMEAADRLLRAIQQARDKSGDGS